MAVEPSVAAVQSTSPASATNRAGVGARFSSGDQLEGASGSPFVSLADHWRTGNDQNPTQGGMNQWLRGGGTPILFTPRVSLAAATFPAIAGYEGTSESDAPLSLLPTDRTYGVGMYEHYMRITSGSARNQGSVINRFS